MIMDSKLFIRHVLLEEVIREIECDFDERLLYTSVTISEELVYNTYSKLDKLSVILLNFRIYENID